MKSTVLHLDSDRDPVTEIARCSRELTEREPDMVIAFLPPAGQRFEPAIAALASTWPSSLRFGCEAVTQFADARLTSGGTLQLFWFDVPEHRPRIEIIHGTRPLPPLPDQIDRLCRMLEEADAAFLICDGLRFPAEEFLSELRQRRLNELPSIAGGLASQSEPVKEPGARVFAGETVLESACLAVLFRGVRMNVEIVRGWQPASPIYTVTRAERNLLWEIDDRPATEWYRHFFERDGQMAPMPDAAYRFPLIIEGPKPERHGLYRSMRWFDQPEGAVTYWGELEPGDQVRLGMGDGGSLVQTASRLSAEPAEAAILYSCVGREVVLGEVAEQELATIHQVLGRLPLSGFFTFGEIGPSARGDLAFYNQTAVLALLHEESA